MCKRYDEPNLPHLYQYRHKSHTSFHGFKIHFEVAEGEGFKLELEKIGWVEILKHIEQFDNMWKLKLRNFKQQNVP